MHVSMRMMRSMGLRIVTLMAMFQWLMSELPSDADMSYDSGWDDSDCD